MKHEEELGRIVFFMGGVRSGTTVFRRMLVSHPRVCDHGEIFNSMNPQGFFNYLREQIAQDPDLVFPEHHGKVFMSYIASLTPLTRNKNPLTVLEFLCSGWLTSQTLMTNANPRVTS